MGRQPEHEKPAASPHRPGVPKRGGGRSYAVTAGGPDPDETESTGGA
ncbi:hypothetical protein ACFUKV_19945 [Streptomyces paradoxus]